MKKFLTIILTALLLSSCANKAQERLAIIIAETARTCPADLGNGNVLQSATYDRKDAAVIFNYMVAEGDGFSVASLADIGPQQKQFLSAFLGREDRLDLLQALIDAGAELKYVFIGRPSGDSVTLTMTIDELRQIAADATAEDNTTRQLEGIVAIANAQCPAQINEALTMTWARIDDNFITYNYEYNDSLVVLDVATMQELHDATKENLRRSFAEPEVELELSLIKDSGLGIKYLYTPASGTGEALQVTVTPEEIAAF